MLDSWVVHFFSFFFIKPCTGTDALHCLSGGSTKVSSILYESKLWLSTLQRPWEFNALYLKGPHMQRHKHVSGSLNNFINLTAETYSTREVFSGTQKSSAPWSALCSMLLLVVNKAAVGEMMRSKTGPVAISFYFQYSLIQSKSLPLFLCHVFGLL